MGLGVRGTSDVSLGGGIEAYRDNERGPTLRNLTLRGFIWGSNHSSTSGTRKLITRVKRPMVQYTVELRVSVGGGGNTDDWKSIIDQMLLTRRSPQRLI